MFVLRESESERAKRQKSKAKYLQWKWFVYHFHDAHTAHTVCRFGVDGKIYDSFSLVHLYANLQIKHMMRAHAQAHHTTAAYNKYIFLKFMF